MLEKFKKVYPIYAGICFAISIALYGNTLKKGYYDEGYEIGKELGKIEGMLELTKAVVEPKK